MSQPGDLAMIARSIIDSNVYMALGTADETGDPWVSPLYFTASQYAEFYWISSPEARHSRNLARRPQVSLVIFDSRVAVGAGQAVYISARAEELTSGDVEGGLAIYNGRFPNPAELGVRLIKLEDVSAPALFRLYRAVASEHWILDPGARSDVRIAVAV